MKLALALVFLASVGVSLQAVPQRVENKGDALCDICKTVADYVKTLITEDFPEDKIEEQAKALCESLPAELATLCTTVVLPLIKQIYEDIQSESSENVCSLLGLC